MPLIDSDTVKGIAIEAMARPELENKIVLGIRVRLTIAERDALSITTIRPCDQTDAQFERHRREKRRVRKVTGRYRERAQRGRGDAASAVSGAMPVTDSALGNQRHKPRNLLPGTRRADSQMNETSPSPPKLLSGG